jgi:predicted adenylyl cyclase CyaB
MEIEIKIKYKNKEKLLSLFKKLSFKFKEKREISDSYFALENSMSNKNNLYRIRTLNNKKELTLKNNCVDKNGIWTRNEFNVNIDNIKDMTSILKSFGCKLIKENSSTREIYEKNRVVLEFIKYKKPKKLEFVEIEGPDEKTIKTLIKKLGDNIEIVGEEIFNIFDNN